MPDPARRAALVAQLRHLADEAEMLRLVLPRVPVALQEGRAHGEAFSLKETLALLAALDTHVRRPTVEGQVPASIEARQAVQAAHDTPAGALIDALVAAREALVAAVEACAGAAWQAPPGTDAPSLDAYLYDVVQEDHQHLRALTVQLFDAQGLGA